MPLRLSCSQLREHACYVTHAPMFYDLTILNAQNIAGGETYCVTRGRDAEIHSLVCASVNEARGYMIFIGDQDLDCDL